MSQSYQDTLNYSNSSEKSDIRGHRRSATLDNRTCELSMFKLLTCFKGRISPILFLKEKLFEVYGTSIFTLAFIKYKKTLAH